MISLYIMGKTAVSFFVFLALNEFFKFQYIYQILNNHLPVSFISFLTIISRFSLTIHGALMQREGMIKMVLLSATPWIFLFTSRELHLLLNTLLPRSKVPKPGTNLMLSNLNSHFQKMSLKGPSRQIRSALKRYCSVSRWRTQKVDKRMVLDHTHGLFIT